MHLRPLDRSTVNARAAAALQCNVDPTLLERPGAVHRSSSVDPQTLDATARERLIEELFATTGEARDEGAVRRFAAELLPADAKRTTLSVYRDDAGYAVGYLAFHEQNVRVEGAPAVALRGEVHLPRHHSPAQVGAFFLGRAARAILGARGRPLYVIQALSDPGAYAWLYRVADRVWPCPARQTPPAIDRVRAQACPQLGLGPAAGDPVLRAVGTALSAASARRWRRHPRPEVHYFVGRNPGFDQGHGLLTVIPVSAGGVLRALLRSALHSLFGGSLQGQRRGQQRPALPSPSADRRHRINRRG